jgi:lysozyme
MATLSLSPDGLTKLKQREGQVLDPVSHNHVPYTDAVGRLTIGFGHLIKPSELKKLSDKKGISDADASSFLVADVAKAEKSVNDRVKVPLTQQQFDSIVSFVFNIGSAKFTEKKCTLLRQLNQGLYTSVPVQLARWNKGVDPKTGKRVAIPGLTNRRASEAQQFKAGTAPVPPDPKHSETSENTENSENSEAKEASEGSELKETSEGSETSEHSEDTEHSEDSEHKEDKDHSEESEHTEDSETSEDSERKEESDGTEGSEGSEDSEHKEESDGSEGSEGSEDSEHKEESDGSEESEHKEDKDLLEHPGTP